MVDRPRVAEHLAWVYQAFWDLHGDRQIGAMGGVGQIPFASIDRYAARSCVDDGDDFTRFMALLRRIDGEYLTHVAEKLNKGE